MTLRIAAWLRGTAWSARASVLMLGALATGCGDREPPPPPATQTMTAPPSVESLSTAPDTLQGDSVMPRDTIRGLQ